MHNDTLICAACGGEITQADPGFHFEVGDTCFLVHADCAVDLARELLLGSAETIRQHAEWSALEGMWDRPSTQEPGG